MSATNYKMNTRTGMVLQYREGREYDNLTYRPVLVLDPEDAAQMEKFALVYDRRRGATVKTPTVAVLRNLTNAVRDMLVTPREQVYEHAVAAGVGNIHDTTYTALCGKVWQPREGVEVVGKCPECEARVNPKWVA